MNGIISDIKRMSVHDGPGIRTTLFLKGCPLRCLWCHNPENLTMMPSLSFTEKLCVGCGACQAVCPAHVHTVAGEPDATDSLHRLNHDACLHCGACVEECFPGALKLYGQTKEAAEVASLLLEDSVFFAESGGGVTFSGGEPLLQSAFLREVMTSLKEKGIHIAVDTCGEVPWQAFEDVLPFTDLFLYDIKHPDSAAHARATGRGNERILENLAALHACGKAVEIRTPVIPGYNDDPETLRQIGTLLAGYGNVTVWRLLPYHSMAKGKYEAIGLSYEMPELTMPDAARMRKLQQMLLPVFERTRLSSDL